MSDDGEKRTLAAFFKPVDGGYVYRAPSGWRLWRRPHFRVDAPLRQRLISAADEPIWVDVLWFAIPMIVVSVAMVVAAVVLLTSSQVDGLAALAGGLAVIFGMVVGLAAMAEHKWRRVASLLRGATPTDERVSLREVSAALQASGGPSRNALWVQLVGGVVVLASGLPNGAMLLTDFGHVGATAWPQLISAGLMVVSGAVLILVSVYQLRKKAG